MKKCLECGKRFYPEFNDDSYCWNCCKKELDLIGVRYLD